MKYRNPLVSIDHPTAHYGDPFVFRYQGSYYLYVSTPDGATNIRVYRSDDLVNWNYLGDAVKEPLLEAAYAPEIIYAYNRFYLITSPKGNGHYIYVGDLPEGPYIRLTDNINSMIDGSFFVGSDAKLHLLRADHAGIALLDVDESGHLTNRRNLDTHLNAWTEGPSLFYRNGYYYLTYCGNHLLSKGYRIAYATSTRFDGEFVEGDNNPLLINTGEGYTRLGHNSVTLGPDLDGFYVIYHTMEQDTLGFLPRKFMVERLQFSGRLMHASVSSFEIEAPHRPYFETHVPMLSLKSVDKFLLTEEATESRFTLETSIKGIGASLIMGYIDSSHYHEIELAEHVLKITKHDGHGSFTSIVPCPFDFTHFHTIRLIADEKSELLIDNALIATLDKFNAGRIGFKGIGSYGYTAFTNHANGSSDAEYPCVLPGIIDARHGRNASEAIIDSVDEIYHRELTTTTYDYVTAHGGKFALFAYAHINKDVALTVNGQAITIKPTISEYNYLPYFLGYFDLATSGTLSIETLKGNFDFKYFTIDEVRPYKLKDLFIHDNGWLIPKGNHDSYLLEEELHSSHDVELEFVIDAIRPNDVFGLLLETREYSNEYPQARFPLLGYLVGFEGNLLVVDRLHYGRLRIYDRPTGIKDGEIHRIRATLSNGKIEVYLDGTLLIVTTISAPGHLGGGGLYASYGSAVRLRHPLKQG
jgi:hypothetical protein